MRKLKILITGGSGLLGQYLNMELSEEFEILTIYNSNVGNCNLFNSARIDLTDIAGFTQLIGSYKPDVVIHTAAYSASVVNKDFPAKYIYSVNVDALRNIAELCEKINAKLVYTSTDLVYAGYRGSLLTEDAKLIPVSLYAETKLMGEIKIKETFDNYLILRTALLFGLGLNGVKRHFDMVYKNLKSGLTVRLFKDQFRTPISLQEAARIIRDLARKDLRGLTLNFGGPERVSRVQLGELLCEAAGFDQNLIEPILMDDVPAVAKVEDVSMNTDKLKTLGIRQHSLAEMMLEVCGKLAI